MLHRLRTAEGRLLQVALKALPKATFVRLRPASVALLRVYNPRALLENGLRNFTCLTAGDEFAVEYNTQLYNVEVVEVRPGDAACIIDADVEVEFATPKEAEAAAQSLSRSVPELEQSVEATFPEPSQGEAPAPQDKGLTLFGGQGQRPDGEPVLPVDDVDCYGDMPWKSSRRIKGGIKHTTPPYGYDITKTHGRSAASRDAPALISAAAMPASSEGAVKLGGYRSNEAASPEALKAQGHEAAQRREAEQAIEIAARRKLEAEEKRRQELEEEDKCRKARELAEKTRQAAPAPVLTAPAQKRMVGPASSQSGTDAANNSGMFCCGCLRGSKGSGERPLDKI